MTLTHTRPQIFDFTASQAKLLTGLDIFCLIMNRTVASGVFRQPTNILQLTGNSGLAITFWIVGGLIVLCITTTWTELALTVPRNYISRSGVMQWVSTPTSGGDKNYLEYIYERPRLHMTCVFGVSFIIFGNMAHNAIQFGAYMTQATNPTCASSACLDEPGMKAQVLGWAIAANTIVSFINVLTRRWGIFLNNAFALFKVSFLVVVAFLGIGWGHMHGDGCRQISFENRDGPRQFGDIAHALVYVIFPYSGFEQPFYVLSEVAQPKKVFARAVVLTMTTALVLYPLVNVGLLCATPYYGSLSLPDNLAISLFSRISDPTGQTQPNGRLLQAMNAILAMFIFGNLQAQTYTGSRVKQEIAKEGIIPFSMFFAASSETLLSRWSSSSSRQSTQIDLDRPHPELAPIAATALHWAVESILILAVGIPLSVSVAYNALTFMRTYVIVVLLGVLTADGLLYLKCGFTPRHQQDREGKKWKSLSQWTPWLDPLPVIVAAAVLTFLVGAVFAPPSPQTQNSSLERGIPWWLPPLVGLSSFVFGFLWWVGVRFREWSKHLKLETRKLPYIHNEPGQDPIQKVVVVEHAWKPDVVRHRKQEGHETP